MNHRTDGLPISLREHEELHGHHYTIAAWIKAPRQRDADHVIIQSQGAFRIYIQKALPGFWGDLLFVASFVASFIDSIIVEYPRSSTRP